MRFGNVMTDKHWTAIGASYAIFAITIATLAQIETSPTRITDQPPVVAQATESPVWRSQRLDLDDTNPRRNYWLTIWVTKSCYGCEQQKAEVPALQEAGYNVVVRKGPPGRWIKSFPHIVINRDRLNGERVTELAGFHTLTQIDEALKIGETPEEEVDEEEDPEYDIFRPKAQVNLFNLVVWLDDSEECDRQYEEIAELRKKGFSANVYVVGGPKRKPRHVTSFPHIVLIHNRPGGGVCVAYWGRFVTAEEILDALH